MLGQVNLSAYDVAMTLRPDVALPKPHNVGMHGKGRKSERGRPIAFGVKVRRVR